MDGLIVIDKPAGPTSHDVVARTRRVLGERRIGHTGTLDPAATGVLPLVLGRATRLARFLSARDKSYRAVITLGVATDTYDAAGCAAGARYRGPWPSREAVEDALARFRGTFLQQPPAFSAKKIEGERSYIAARAGRRSGGQHSFNGAGARRSRRRLPESVAVTAYAIEVVGVEDDTITLTLECSAGFYVRSLAHELGQRLGTGAHLSGLQRTRSGDFTLAHALTLDAAERDRAAALAAVISLERMLPGLATVVLTAEGARHAAHGRDLGPADAASGFGPHALSRLVDPAGALLGVAEPSATPGLLHPSVVLV